MALKLLKLFFRCNHPYLGVTIHYINKNWELIKFLAYCGSAEGRHTSVLVAAHLDKVISEMKGIKSDTYRVCTSDNAPNMLAAIPNKTEQINAGLGCIDHLFLTTTMKTT